MLKRLKCSVTGGIKLRTLLELLTFQFVDITEAGYDIAKLELAPPFYAQLKQEIDDIRATMLERERGPETNPIMLFGFPLIEKHDMPLGTPIKITLKEVD